GAFLFGVARKIAVNHRAGRARKRISLAKFRCRPSAVSDLNVKQTIEDLSLRASFAEKRFLQESLLAQPGQKLFYSKTNRWQLSHRLFNKLWPLVYGPEIPCPRQEGRRPGFQLQASKSSKSKPRR